MKAGDKVIINPCIKEGTWNKKGTCAFHDFMRKKGVFTLQEPHSDDGSFVIDDYCYAEEWLLPVPLFKPGDKVRIKYDLSAGDCYPHGVCDDMENLAGQVCTIENVLDDTYPVEAPGHDGFRYYLKEDTGRYTWCSLMFVLSDYKQLKYSKDESRLQEQESPLRRGSREFTSGIRCRVNRARVEICSPGYQEVTGRG